MKSFYLLSTLLTLATSAPTSTPITSIQLRLIGPSNTHYTSSSQTPSTNNGHIITLVVGQPLSLSHNPLLLQGLEVIEGTATSGVQCTASLEPLHEAVTVKSGAGPAILDGGKMVKVTGLNCV